VSLLTLILATDPGWSRSDKMVSKYVASSIKVDGRYDDWRDLPSTFLEEQKAVVAISNDNQNLYLMFRTNDPRWVRTISRSGLTIYVDPKGGKKKDFFVRFKGGPSREQLLALVGRGGETPDGARRQMPEGREPQMDDRNANDTVPTLTCYVKERIEEKLIPLDGTEGPAAAFDTSRGFFVYEFKLPIKESELRYYGFAAEPGKELSIGLIWGEMDQMRGERPKGGMDFGGPGGGPGSGPGGLGGGGGMGGGMGRGGGMGGPPGGMQRPSKQEIWVKTTLAKE
jgi:hypothetical protein